MGAALPGAIRHDGVVTSNRVPPSVVGGGQVPAFDMIYRCFERQWFGLPAADRLNLVLSDSLSFARPLPPSEDITLLWWTELPFPHLGGLALIAVYEEVYA